MAKKAAKKTAKKNDEKIVVTSALPYVNNVPHLGTLICVLSADVYTRYLKLRNKNVISVLGTDEHGTTTEVKAQELGITPQECVDRYFKIHKELYEWFECYFDCFGRTSSKENHEISKDIFVKLQKNGYIIEREIEQLFCTACNKFLADRFIEGKCPHCKYEKARGDQCDNCSKLLNPTDLLDARCIVCHNKPIVKKSNHLFIDLPKLQPQLESWIKTVEKTWSQNAKTTTHGWLKQGLKERAITRDLKWGIPVPGYPGKVFYSWFDAPIGYISITKETRKDWQDWWKNKETKLVQFMGKDNIPFHTILFPAFLIGADDGYILVRELSVNEYLNYESGKFSKSLNQGVFCDDAKNTGIPADVWRYYLLMNRPEESDALFTWDGFLEKTNNELVANLGNLVNRTLFFINKYYDSVVPHAHEKNLSYDAEVKKIETLLDAIKLKEALKEIMLLSKKANAYFQEHEPWKTITSDKKRADTALFHLVNLIKDLSILIHPYLPQTSAQIQQQLHLKALSWNDLKKPVPAGHKINTAALLFKKLEEKQIQRFKEQFAGKKAASGENAASLQKTTSVEKSYTADKTGVGDFSILDIKVAKVLSVSDHPNAEKLYVLQIDLGNEQRQIVAGLREHYAAEDLTGKHILVVTNLEPAKLRGEASNGMLLAAEQNGTVGVLLAEHAASGMQITVNNIAPQTKQIKYADFLQVKIIAQQGRAFWNTLALTAGGKPVTVDKNVEGLVH
ncbi:methionine--tRNA ligase [Candidatus Woesearchaeota archaeon]|nr:MAG: methionine--tRNA ligase [Candidatus Woesearchaeota archaeon]